MEKCFWVLRFCTSIVAQDKNGTVYHGRNLDYPHPMLRNMTLNAVFLRKGKVQCKKHNNKQNCCSVEKISLEEYLMRF